MRAMDGDAGRDSGPLKRVLSALGLLAASCLFALGLAEAVTRIVMPPAPVFRWPQVRHTPDPRTGYVIVPAQDAFTHDKPVHINGLGLRRDDEVPAAPREGVPRVLVLGDSFTFGNGVLADETYPAVLEQLLAARGERAEVLNAGVQGYSVHQEAAWLASRGFPLQPAVVVLGFYANDISIPEDLADLARRTEEEGALPVGGLRRFFSDEAVYALKRLQVFSLAAHALREMQYRFSPPASDYWTKAIVKGEETEKSKQAWSAVGESLRQIRDGCRERGIPLVVLIQPMPWQVEPGAPDTTYQQPLLAILHGLGVEAVDVLGAYRAAAQQGERLFIPYDGHPTVLGQRLSAEALAPPVAAALAQRERAPAEAAGPARSGDGP